MIDDKIKKLRDLLKRGEDNQKSSPLSINRVEELFQKLSELPEEIWSFNCDKLKGLDLSLIHISEPTRPY